MSATVHYLPAARGLPGAAVAAREVDWAAEADGVLDAVEELLLTGRAADVIAFCEVAIACLEANAGQIDDPAPLIRLARRLGDLERRASPGNAGRRRRPAPRLRRRHPSSR